MFIVLVFLYAFCAATQQPINKFSFEDPKAEFKYLSNAIAMLKRECSRRMLAQEIDFLNYHLINGRKAKIPIFTIYLTKTQSVIY